MKKKNLVPTSPSPNYAHSPSERVREYLGQLGKNLRAGETLRIPPVRQLAKDLKVSTATIYHIFKEMNAAGTISTTVGRGSFLKGASGGGNTDRLTVGLSWPSSGDQPLNRSVMVTHAIFQATMDMDVRIDLRPIPIEAFESETQKDYIMRQADEVDALIHRSSMSEFEGLDSLIEQTYEQRGKPVVRLDSPSLCATRNFVAPDIYAASREAARAWAQAGRRNIAYLMKDSVNATVSTLYTFIGLKSGMAMGGAGDQRIINLYCEKVSDDAAYDAVINHLKKNKKAPDAVYCFGDMMAVGAIIAFEEKGLRIPEDVSIIGGTGFDANHPVFSRLRSSRTLGEGGSLTCARFSYEAIAKSLLSMVVDRVRREGGSVPGTFIPGTIIQGSTTRPEENALFPPA